MITATNAENLRQYESNFFIVEQMLAFAMSTKVGREVKNVSLNFKQIA